MSKHSVPHVTVLVPTSSGWGRQLLRGVHQYACIHGPWDIWFEERGEDELQRLRPSRLGDGVIAQIATPGMARHLLGADVPIVNISSARLPGVNVPRVSKDLAAAGRMAMIHLTERGFRNFAYCAFPRSYFIEDHRKAFLDALATAGHGCSVFCMHRKMSRNWQARQAHLASWLQGLPKPLGVFTWDIVAGRAVIDAAKSVGFDVPDKVAVLAGDDDDLICETSHPPLSGIPFPAAQLGHEAASLLAVMMNGWRPKKTMNLVKPNEIIVRQSTDILAIEDPDLLGAIRFIRDHCGDTIQVKDVVNSVAISRRSLEYRFHQLLGRTIAAEIRRVHIAQARRLLAQSEMSIDKVATASGFGSPEYMSCVFKADVGLTPLKYRSHVRGVSARVKHC